MEAIENISRAILALLLMIGICTMIGYGCIFSLMQYYRNLQLIRKEGGCRVDKINWKQKLSSRKFWAAVAGWISSILTAFNVTDNVIAQVGIIVAGIGSLTVYILAETKVDTARAKQEGDNS